MKELEKCRYICKITGKPVVVLNDIIQQHTLYILVDEYKGYNPGSYIYENFVSGKDITLIMNTVSGVSTMQTGFISNQDDMGLLQKIEAMPILKLFFPNSENYPYIRITS